MDPLFMARDKEPNLLCFLRRFGHFLLTFSHDCAHTVQGPVLILPDSIQNRLSDVFERATARTEAERFMDGRKSGRAAIPVRHRDTRLRNQGMCGIFIKLLAERL